MLSFNPLQVIFRVLLQKAQMNGVNNMFEGSRPGTGSGYHGNQPVAVEAMVVEDYGTMTPPPQGT